MQENGSDAFDEQDYSQVSHHVVLLDRPGSICHQFASNELYNHNQFLIHSGSIAEPCKILTWSLLLQSADAYEEMRNLQLAQAESAEDDDDANPTEEEINKKICLGAKNITV